MIAAAAIAGFIIGAGLTLSYFAWRIDVYERRLMRQWKRDLSTPYMWTSVTTGFAPREGEEVVAESTADAAQNPGADVGRIRAKNQSADVDPSVTGEGSPTPPPHLRLLPGARTIRTKGES